MLDPINLNIKLRLLATLFFAVLVTSTSVSAQKPLIKTSLQLNWMFQFEFAGPIAAVEKGFYRDAGLQVVLRQGGPEIDPVSPVAKGEIDFGIAGSSLVVERFNGKPVVALASMMQHSAVGLLARRSAGIGSVFDLKGKRLAISFDTADEIEAYLESQGIQSEDYQLIDHFVPVEDLDAGKADAIAVYVSNELYHIRERVDDYMLFTPRSSGIDLFGNILFSNETLVAQRPELVEAFRKATLKGWEYALTHPREIAEILVSRYNPQNKTLQHLLFEARKLTELTRPDIVEPGYMSAGRWRHVADVYAAQGKIAKSFDLRGFLYDPNPKVDLTWFYLSLLGGGLITTAIAGTALHFKRMSQRLLAANQATEAAQKALAQSEERFRYLFESSPDPVWIIEQERFTDCNQAALNLLGHPDKTGLARIHPAALAPETQPDLESSRDKFEHKLRMARDQGSVMFEWVAVRADGSQFFAEVTLSAITLQGQPVIYCVWRDITDRKIAEFSLKRAESAMKQRNEALEISNRALQDFAYVASHDLQEPLRKIRTFGDRLRTKYNDSLDERGQDYLERMLNAAERMQNLISSLLSYSRVTTQAKDFEPVDLKDILGGVIDDLEARIEDCGARINIGNLPVVHADALQMRQLFQNLVGNALKFQREGVMTEVRVEAHRPDPVEAGGDFWEIRVTDNGIGFDEKYSQRIFEVFERLNHKALYQGTGIGLAICRKIVERHGGKITALGKPGAGAVFSVTLPRRHMGQTTPPKTRGITT